MSFLFSQVSGLFKFSVSLFEYLLFPAIQFVCWGNVANGAMQPDGVVVLNVLLYNSAAIVKGKRYSGTNAFALDGFVESLQFAV